MVDVKRSRGGTQPNALSRDDVLDAGLAVVAAHGLDALSVTLVARELGVSSPAVYHYLTGKEDLVNRVCERVAGQVQLPLDDGGRWDDQVVAVIISMISTFARYPGVAARVLPARRPSRAVNRLSAAVRKCIIDGGFEDDAADDVLAAIHFLVGGWLLGQRPNLPAASTAPAVLERAIRWTLAGASAEGRQRAVK